MQCQAKGENCPGYKQIMKDAEDARDFYNEKYDVIAVTPWLWHSMKIIQLKSYQRLRRECSCCTCNNHCIPCFTTRIRQDMIHLLNEIIQYETDNRLRGKYKRELAKIQKEGEEAMRPRTL